MPGSYYQSGKNWARKKLHHLDADHKASLICLFYEYKSIDCRYTKKGVLLTPSKRQFYYGAANFLKTDL
ncbi:MAG: hypothetical protein WCS51_04015 [Bacilli bacterium]